MRLSDLKKNNLAHIKSLNIKDNDLKIHLMEMGLVNNTPVKIIRISHNKNLFTIFFRNYELTLSKEIVENIEVI